MMKGNGEKGSVGSGDKGENGTSVKRFEDELGVFESKEGMVQG